METGIPLEIKIIITIFCAVLIFLLAAWERVLEWLKNIAGALFKPFFFKLGKGVKGFFQNGKNFIKQKPTRTV